MPTSVEKVQAFREALAGPPAPDATPAELMMRTAVQMGGTAIDQLVPADPRDLDVLLSWAGDELHRMRSDGYVPEDVSTEQAMAALGAEVVDGEAVEEGAELGP